MFHWALNTSLLLLRNYHFCTRPYYNISIKSAYTRILFDNPFHLYTDIDNVNPLSNLFPDSFQKLPSNLDNNIYKNNLGININLHNFEHDAILFHNPLWYLKHYKKDVQAFKKSFEVLLINVELKLSFTFM